MPSRCAGWTFSSRPPPWVPESALSRPPLLSSRHTLLCRLTVRLAQSPFPFPSRPLQAADAARTRTMGSARSLRGTSRRPRPCAARRGCAPTWI
jgi:hypothetical protein